MCTRCSWVNLNNPKYVSYHDNEWGIRVNDDRLHFEALSLEILQSGLSFECILNKRDGIRLAFDNFDIDRIINYDDEAINSLMNNKEIIRSKAKILAIINNASCFKKIQDEFKSFNRYIWGFTCGDVVYESGRSKSELSDKICADLKMRGFRHIGTTTIYSYLASVGVIDAHDLCCYKHKKN